MSGSSDLIIILNYLSLHGCRTIVSLYSPTEWSFLYQVHFFRQPHPLFQVWFSPYSTNSQIARLNLQLSKKHDFIFPTSVCHSIIRPSAANRVRRWNKWIDIPDSLFHASGNPEEWGSSRPILSNKFAWIFTARLSSKEILGSSRSISIFRRRKFSSKNKPVSVDRNYFFKEQLYS